MRKIINIILICLMVVPSISNADGIGVYMLNAFNDDTYNADYGYAPGIGITYDTNLGENKLFSYRLGVDYSQATGTGYIYSYDSNGSESVTSVAAKKRTVSIVNTFGFGLYRSEKLRFWIGPQVSMLNIDENIDTYNTIDIAMGPAIGLNYNISDAISVAVDADFNVLGGDNALVARVYLFWRFGEKFIPRKQTRPVVNNQDLGSRLKYIKQLRVDDILTQDEYERKREEIINSY